MSTAIADEAVTEDHAWDRFDVATYLRICVRQLADLRRDDPTFPAPRMVGRKPIWAPRSITTWVEKPAVESAPPARPKRRGATQRVL